MPILNYTTTIAVHKTVSEIQEKLAKAGAIAVSIDYDEQKQPSALTFAIMVRNYPVNFRLPSRWNGVYHKVRSDYTISKKLRTEEQARRVAWRIVKDWVEAQLALIDAGCAELPEVFLPYAVSPTGETLFEKLSSSPQLIANIPEPPKPQQVSGEVIE